MWSEMFEALVFLLLIHLWIKHRLSYWKRVGVCSIKGKYLLGNMKKFWKRHVSESIAESYQKLKHKDVVGGFYYFLRPILLVFDPVVIEYILVKDRAYFSTTTGKDDQKALSSEGHPQKELRPKITNTFTTTELRLMFDTVLKVATELEQHVDQQQLTNKRKPIDVTDLCSRFALDIVANCCFGVENNSFADPSNKFRKMAAKVSRQTVLKRLKGLFCVDAALPEISTTFGVRSKDANSTAHKFFEMIIAEKVEEQRKNRTGGGGASKRNDLISTLLAISRTRANEVPQLTIQDIYDEAMPFLTTSGNNISHSYVVTATTLSWCLYELGKSAVVQDKLIDEVDSVLKRYNNPLSFEVIEQMTYLQQVVSGGYLWV